jgi:AraC-like DNA-binding protein
MNTSPCLNRFAGAPVRLLSATLNVVAKRGYDTDAILAQCGIPRSELADISNRVTTEQYFAFNTYLLEHTNVPELGLLQAGVEKLVDFGLIGMAVISCENLGMALPLFEKYRPLVGPICDYHSEIHDDNVVIVFEGNLAHMPYRWSVECALAGFASAIRFCLPNDAKFAAVRLTYSAPDYADVYREVFGCPAYFEQGRNELCFPKSLLDIPFASANSVLRELCLRECDKILHSLRADNPLIDQVEAIIRSFPGALPQFPLVAETLTMSPRTLHRRLTEEGTSYRQIVENLRKRLAKEYLTEARLEQKQVAYLLGYTEPANFYHAFQRWFGCTPAEFRESL